LHADALFFTGAEPFRVDSESEKMSAVDGRRNLGKGRQECTYRKSRNDGETVLHDRRLRLRLFVCLDGRCAFPRITL